MEKHSQADIDIIYFIKSLWCMWIHHSVIGPHIIMPKRHKPKKHSGVWSDTAGNRTRELPPPLEGLLWQGDDIFCVLYSFDLLLYFEFKPFDFDMLNFPLTTPQIVIVSIDSISSEESNACDLEVRPGRVHYGTRPG